MSTTLDVRDAPVRPPASRPEAGPPQGFRPDIEGLRAIAVVLVVLGHAGVGAFAGGYIGVDVFFVISGFLITTLLLKELRRDGTVSLRRFYARRALRLLPLSTVVLVATLAASWLWLPSVRFGSIATDGLFSTFYGINWRLAYEGTDYLAATAAPSPLQHLWSLAVEEQFYLIWPLLLLVVFARRRVVTVLTALVVVSLAVSVQQTASAAPWAYFGSHTRAWELGIGALVAVFGGVLARTPKKLAAVLTWLGLAAIVGSALLYDKSTPFPGYQALLPVLGTAAVIAGGFTARGLGAGAVLGTAPFRFVGKLSYGWYLWHWPVLMIWPAVFARDATIRSNLVFALAALGLAWVTYHLVENPVRRRRWMLARARRGLGLGLALSAATAVIIVVAVQFTPPVPVGPSGVNLLAEVATAPDPQARLTELITEANAQTRMPRNLTPALNEAHEESPQIYADRCHLNYTQHLGSRRCVYGDPAADRTMYLIGDSHAAHWFPAFDDIARDHGYRLVALTKAACRVPDVLVWIEPLKRPYTECVTWRERVIDRIVGEKPDLVVMASNDHDDGGMVDRDGNLIPREGHADDPLWVEAWKRSWARLAGTPMVMLQDTPWPRGDAPECVAANPRAIAAKCSRAVHNAVAEPARRRLVADAAREAGVKVVDPTPWFCAERCPAVVGDTLVFKDNSHMTPAYARAIEPLISRAVLDRPQPR